MPSAPSRGSRRFDLHDERPRAGVQGLSDGLGRVSNREGRSALASEATGLNERCESVGVNVGHLVDVDDEVEISLIADQIAQQVANPGTTLGGELSMHRDDDVVGYPSNRDIEARGCIRRSRSIGKRAARQQGLSRRLVGGFVEAGSGRSRASPDKDTVSSGIDEAGRGFVVTVPVSSCHSTQNCDASGNSVPSTASVSVTSARTSGPHRRSRAPCAHIFGGRVAPCLRRLLGQP